jgi:pyridoxamine 5'-phosphate oxidase
MTVDPVKLLAGCLPGVPGVDGYFPPMALATVDTSGVPDVRTVLLSEITADGVVFHTDDRSRKVEQLAANPSAAMMILVPEESRQIVVRGNATRITGPELSASYRARSRYLRLLAWLNTPEMSSLPVEERRRRWAEFADAHPDAFLQAPTEWAGFSVRADRITFWQGDVDGPSARVEYSRTPIGWSAIQLPG